MISVVVPVFNERQTIEKLLLEIQFICSNAALDHEVIFVDDGSTDGTWTEVRRMIASHECVRGIQLTRNYGKAAALMAGFEHAKGDVIITIDGDLQDDPREIPRMVAALEQGFDVVSGWKKIRHDPISKRLPSKVFNWAVNRLSGTKLHDHNCGYKAYRASALKGLCIYGELHRYIPVILAARGYRICEITVAHRSRPFGKSKYGTGRLIKGFLDFLTVTTLTIFRQRPLHLFGGIGLIGVTLGLGGLVYLAIIWLAGQPIGTRPLLIYSAAALILGFQFVATGMIGELITSYLIRSSQIYSVRESEASAPPVTSSPGAVVLTPSDLPALQA